MTCAPRPHARRTLAPQPAPAGIFASKYDPLLGAAICRRLAAGESLRAICRADASMPTEKTVWNWARAHPEFRLMKLRAQGAARARALAERDAALAAAKAAGPRRGLRGRAWNAGLDGYDPAVGEAICDRLAAGEALADLCRDAAMPSTGTVYNWLKRYPEFLARYRLAKAAAVDVLVDEAAEDAPWLRAEAASMRALDAAVSAAHRRCAKISCTRYAEQAVARRVKVVAHGPDGRHPPSRPGSGSRHSPG